MTKYKFDGIFSGTITEVVDDGNDNGNGGIPGNGNGNGGNGNGDDTEFDVVIAHEKLLAKSTGYFKSSGGTGGQGGDVRFVSNLNDAGPGSLREAVTQAEPLIILFENGLNGTINISSDDVEVRSDKTIWGRHRDGTSADIFVHPTNNKATPFQIRDDNRNVIITNIKGDAPGPNDDAPDFIEVRDEGGVVWVHHVTVIGDQTSNMDGFVDIHADGVTLSWNRCLDWDNACLCYPYADPANMIHVTMHHNLWDHVNGRTPKAKNANTFLHCYNNWVRNWGYDAMRSEDQTEIRAENNIFSPGAFTSDLRAIQGTWGGSGNVFEGGSFPDSSQAVSSSAYTYDLDPVSTAGEIQALKDEINANAGWQ